jgi:tripartite-type tricarboxylate transporter receptor subunit TctC
MAQLDRRLDAGRPIEMVFPVQRRALLRLMLASGALAVSGRTLAQSYPDRPIRLIVPFPPGGGTDVAGRIVADRLQARIGRPVVVENRAGANGNIATAAVARAPNDGYTLLFASTTHVINPSLYANIAFDPVKDFIPLSLSATTPPILVAHPSVQARNLEELIALMKANPGMSYGSTGAGTAQHLAGELLKLRMGLDIVHIPFNGGGPAVSAVLGNHIPLLFNSLPAVLPLIRTGALRPIAVTTLKRTSFAPDVPTFDESGVSGFDIDQFTGVLAPAGTAKPIVDLLAENLQAIIRDPDTVSRLRAAGFEPVGTAPEQFAAIIRRDLSRWHDIIKRAGIPLIQ